jgi:hypothetical protein
MELASGMGFPPPLGANEDYHFFFKNVNLWAIRESPLHKTNAFDVGASRETRDIVPLHYLVEPARTGGRPPVAPTDLIDFPEPPRQPFGGFQNTISMNNRD